MGWTFEQRRYLLRVRQAVHMAIERGDLTRPESRDCVACGDLPADLYHHDDYGSPLDVRPLCRDCHVGWHRKNGRGILPWPPLSPFPPGTFARA